MHDLFISPLHFVFTGSICIIIFSIWRFIVGSLNMHQNFKGRNIRHNYENNDQHSPGIRHNIERMKIQGQQQGDVGSTKNVSNSSILFLQPINVCFFHYKILFCKGNLINLINLSRNSKNKVNIDVLNHMTYRKQTFMFYYSGKTIYFKMKECIRK